MGVTRKPHLGRSTTNLQKSRRKDLIRSLMFLAPKYFFLFFCSTGNGTQALENARMLGKYSIGSKNVGEDND
jgi:hypothetical protein